jgi:photosystem II stability/assembly factor-like uncharacterized protein
MTRALIAAVLLFSTPLRPGSADVLIDLRFAAKLPESGDLTRAVFKSPTEGWLFSRSNIWRTSDGASTWHRLAVPESQYRIPGRIDAVQLFDGRGLSLRENQLFQTVDGGTTWTTIPPLDMGGHGGEIWGIHFLAPGRVGWAYGGVYRVAKADEDGPNSAIHVDKHRVRLIVEPAIFRTDDAGFHWRRQNLPEMDGEPLGYRIRDLQFSDSTHGVAVAESSVVYTDDGGNHWRLGHMYSPGCARERRLNENEDEDFATIRLVYLLAPQHGWLSPDDGSLYRTMDAGHTWCEVLPPGTIQSQFAAMASFFVSLAFRSPDLGWGVEGSGALLETHDGGRTWVRVRPLKTRFSQILLLDQDHGWAIADDGLYGVTVRN